MEMEGKKDVEESLFKEDKNGKLIPDYDKTIKNFSEGDIISGTVVRVDRDEVLVDIGYKSEGVIPARELSIKYNVSPDEVVKIGDTIDALVLQKEDKEGRLILSKKRAEYERVWQKLEAIKEIDGTVKGRVIEVVKGGLIVDIGLRGFVPASLVNLKRPKDLEQYVGKEFTCKIIELNRSRNNVVLSRKAYLESEKKAERKRLLETLEKGQIVEGTVSSIVSFGAFVDLGGVDGLIHISELSWEHVDHPSEVLSVGDKVKVEVLDVDKKRGRVSLGFKQTQPDPWKEKVKRFRTGEIVEGTVTKLVSFGAFVEIAEGVEGLIHISELSEKRVESPEKVVKVGEKIRVKIIDIDLSRRRLSLSLKQAVPTTEVSAPPSEAEEKAPVKTVDRNSALEKATSTENEVPAERVEKEERKEEKIVKKKIEKKEEKEVPEESATETTLREVEKVEREVEPVRAEEIVSPEPGTLESVLEQMKKESKSKEKKKGS